MQLPISPSLRPALSGEEVGRAILPLRLIFWGGLLCVFDITFTTTTNGEGFRFDILNDAVGMIMITVGVFKLAAIPVSGSYATAMGFVQVVSVLGVADAIREHFIIRLPDFVHMALALFGLVTMVAIVVFCMAMRRFCVQAQLWRSVRSWWVTTVLFILIYLLPLGLFHLAALAAMVSGKSFHIELGPLGLLLLPVFALPIIHLFVSTSRMKREAQTMAALAVAPPPGAGWQPPSFG